MSQLYYFWAYSQRTPYLTQKSLGFLVYCCFLHKSKESESAKMTINRMEITQGLCKGRNPNGKKKKRKKSVKHP